MDNKTFQLIFYTLRLAHPKLANVTARLPLAQARIESGNWTKPIFTSYKNMFGMKQPVARQTVSLGPSPTGFATFRSAWDSINDYLLWLEAIGLYTDADLEKRLISQYAIGDKDYQKKVNAVAAQIAPDLISPAAFLLKTAAAVAGAVAVGSIVKKSL